LHSLKFYTIIYSRKLATWKSLIPGCIYHILRLFYASKIVISIATEKNIHTPTKIRTEIGRDPFSLELIGRLLLIDELNLLLIQLSPFEDFY